MFRKILTNEPRFYQCRHSDLTEHGRDNIKSGFKLCSIVFKLSWRRKKLCVQGTNYQVQLQKILGNNSAEGANCQGGMDDVGRLSE